MLLTFALVCATAGVLAVRAPLQPVVRDSPAIEPYAYVHGGSFSGPPVPQSPDPLVQYQWAANLANASALQLYDLRPVAITQQQGSASAFANLSSLLAPATTPAAVVSGAGAFTFDIGTESAAWVEFDSPDLLDADLPLVQLGISEWANVALKSLVPVKYGTTFRLETNAQV